MNKKDVFWGTGRRKTSVARVSMIPGKGAIVINTKEQDLPAAVAAPLILVGKNGSFDITVTVKGGGVNGQVEAMRHGVANALIKFSPDFRPTLRKAGFLTRDDRSKERKKYGLKKARRAPQWSKR